MKEAVSYTHLDVYKRQLLWRSQRLHQKGRRDRFGNHAAAPVSYTHLDVYKRQAYSRRGVSFCADRAGAEKVHRQQGGAGGKAGREADTGRAVSYTHLDVYKRQ